MMRTIDKSKDKRYFLCEGCEEYKLSGEKWTEHLPLLCMNCSKKVLSLRWDAEMYWYDCHGGLDGAKEVGRGMHPNFSAEYHNVALQWLKEDNKKIQNLK